jgi:hypothetical protein
VDGSFFWGTNFIYPDTAMNGEQGGLGLAFSPLDLLGLRVSTNFRRAQFTTAAANASSNYPLTGVSLDNWTFSARIASRKLGIFRLAAEPKLAIPASNWCAPVDGASKCGGTFEVSPGLTGLVSVDLPFFRAHVNVGYTWDNSAKVAQIKSSTGQTVYARPSSFDMFALSLSSYDDFAIGVAAEVPLGPVTPYVEWGLDIPVNRAAFSSCKASGGKTCQAISLLPVKGMWQIPDRLGGGLRFDFNEFVRLDLGFEASLTAAGQGMTMPSATATATAEPLPVAGVLLPPPFLIRAALNWQFDLFAKPAAPVSDAAHPAARKDGP